MIVKKPDCNKCNFKSELVIKEYPQWIAEVSDSPTPIGWIYIILKRHVEYFDKLTDEELVELKGIVRELKGVLVKAFSPDWFNVMQLGNGGRHLHFHLVPRYKREVSFAGSVFSDPDYGRMLVDRYEPYPDRELLFRLRDFLKKQL